MAERDQLYQKFGEVSEAAQLLETELGNMLLEISAGKHGLFVNPDKAKATELLKEINKSTLGKLIRNYNPANSASSDDLCNLLEEALSARNTLSHSFFRNHNLRINSKEGRDLMISDLEVLYKKIFEAYVKLLVIQGIDLHKLSIGSVTGHLPI